MNRDLDAALRDLAHGAAAQHRAAERADVLLTPTVRRVRRRRAARGAAVTTTGLALVVGVALAGFGLSGQPEPQPAAPDPTPTTTAPGPTPTPTPTGPAPVVLPTGDAALPFGTCGSLASTPPAPPVSPSAVARAEPLTSTAPAGGSLLVRGSVDRTGGADTIAVPASGPRVAVVADGVVVAETLLGADPAWELRAGVQGEARTTLDRLSLAVCAPDGQPGVTAGAPLPAGDYQLVPWSDVVDLDAPDDVIWSGGDGPSVDELIATYGAPAIAVGPATTFTVTGTATQVVPPPGSTGTATPIPTTAAVPGCGDPAPVADPANPLVLPWDRAGTRLSPVDLVGLEVPLTSTSAGRIGFSLGQPWAAAIRDGRVVGVSELSWESDGRFLLATGTSVVLHPPVTDLWDCADPMLQQHLPAGTYDLVLLATIWPEDPEGNADGTFTSTVVVSEPATLVIP